jgi:hypothetical protein
MLVIIFKFSNFPFQTQFVRCILPALCFFFMKEIIFLNETCKYIISMKHFYVLTSISFAQKYINMEYLYTCEFYRLFDIII